MQNMTRQEFLRHLAEIQARVTTGDSREGYVHYAIAEPGAKHPLDAEIRFRTGEREGRPGVRLIGPTLWKLGDPTFALQPLPVDHGLRLRHHPLKGLWVATLNETACVQLDPVSEWTVADLKGRVAAAWHRRDEPLVTL